MKRREILIPWLGIVFLLLGMLQSFSTVFDYPVAIKWSIAPVCIMVAAMLFISNFFRVKNTILGILLTMGLLCFWCVWNWQKLQAEGETFLYYINQKKLAYDGSQFTAFTAKAVSTDLFSLLCVCGIVCSLFMGVFAVRLLKGFYGLLPLYLLLILELSVGKTPDLFAMILLILGVLLCCGWKNCQDMAGGRNFFIEKLKRRKPYARYGILVSAGIISMTLALFCSAGTQDFFLKGHKKYLQWQHRMERMAKEEVEKTAWKLCKWFYMDDDGSLSNTEPKYNDRTVLKVTFGMKPTADVYLKGFTGGEYQNGKWTYPKENEFKKIFSTKEMQEEYWNINYDYAQYGFEGTIEEEHPWDSQKRVGQVQIDYVGAGKSSNHTYLPYFCDVPGATDQNGEQALFWDGADTIKRSANTIYTKSVLPGNATLKELIAFADTNMATLADYGNVYQLQYYSVQWDMLSPSVANEYIQYVKQKYCRLPKNGLTRFRKLSQVDPVLLEYRQNGWCDRDMTSCLSIASTIRKYLADQAVYSLDLDTVPDGQDYVEYFLFHQKKGFCEHFATAGTLLLREIGVPARYASGYKIEADAFKENGDGTYTAEILDSDAHAWTEVFSEWGGWIPAEMTPDSSGTHRREKTQTETPLPTKKNVSFSEKTEGTQTEETLESTPTPVVVTSTPKPAASKHSTAGTKKAAKRIGLLVCLLGILAGMIGYPRIRCWRYLKCEHKATALREKIVAHTEGMLYLLRLAGIRQVAACREQEWILLVVGKSLKPQDAEVDIDDKRLSEIIEKAVFAQSEISDREYWFYQKECAKLLRKFYYSRIFIKRLYLKIVCPMKMFI